MFMLIFLDKKFTQSNHRCIASYRFLDLSHNLGWSFGRLHVGKKGKHVGKKGKQVGKKGKYVGKKGKRR